MKSRLVDREVRIVIGSAQISPRSPTPSKRVKEQIVNILAAVVVVTLKQFVLNGRVSVRNSTRPDITS